MAPAVEMGDALYRARRLRAFRGPAEAEAYATAMMSEACGERCEQQAGLSQAVLDSLSECSDEVPEATRPPDALCFLLKRTRAFQGAGVAEALARELLDACVSEEALALPVGCSPKKQGGLRDPLDTVSSPSRRRRGGA